MEYGEMMRQFRRFCAAQAAMAEHAEMGFQCFGCPLENNSVCDKLPDAVKPEDVAEVERVVTRWAEEHPVVYPTWYEWLTSVYPAAWALIADKPIPADIAQKLGIEPVPIVHSDCGATNETDARKKLGIEPKECI